MFVAQSSENNNNWLRTNVGEIVSKDNIDSYIPKLDTNSARTELEKLQNIQNKINETKGSWDDYNNKFQNGRKYLLDYAKANNVLETSVDNVKEANKKAREAAIAHNDALKQQTLGAKAAKVGMQALATAGNMVAMWAISEVIGLAVTSFNNFVHGAENAKKSAESFNSSITSLQSEFASNTTKISELNSEYTRLSKGVSNLGENISLTSDEYDTYWQQPKTGKQS